MTTIFIASLLLALAILCASFLRHWRRFVTYWLRVYDRWERQTFPGLRRLQWRHYLQLAGERVWIPVVAVLVVLWVMTW